MGSTSNRDAIGARVIVETDRLRRTKIVQAGSGFLSQHSKELLFGLGESQRIAKLTVVWPSGTNQVFTDVPLNTRVRLVEGQTITSAPLAPKSAPASGGSQAEARVASRPDPSRGATWFFEPFPAPDFSLEDLGGQTRSLAALGGRPAVVLFWSSAREPRCRCCSSARARERGADPGRRSGARRCGRHVRRSRRVWSRRRVPRCRVVASREVGLSYAILNRHLFMNRQDLRLPTALLLDRGGQRRQGVSRPAGRSRTSFATSRRSKRRRPNACREPCRSRERSIRRCRCATTCPTDGSCSIRVSRRPPRWRSSARRRRTRARPRSIAWARCSRRVGETDRARAAFERALALQPDLAEANNDLGALLAQGGDIDGGHRALPRRARVDA